MSRLGTGLLLLALVAGGCAPAVDLKTLQVTGLTSGWFDAGVVDAKNKLVPSLTFRVTKPAGTKLDYVSLNMVFKKVGEQDHWEDVFLQRVEFQGDQTNTITVRSQNGYTGEPPQSRLEMLKHSLFVDMDVQIFAKQSSSQWTELQHTRIARQLLTQ
jgi:hypothetical protein